MLIENIHWLGHDSFLLEDARNIIYIDPWKLRDQAKLANYIFITHHHYDHFSKSDILKIKTDQTIIIGPADVAAEIGGAISIRPYQEINFKGLKVKAIPAYNIGKNFHPKDKNWVGYLLTLSDGTTLYHAGDTDFIPEMRNLVVDIAMLPVSGTYVMTAEEAVKAANTFKPKIAIPMHYGDIIGNQTNAEVFKAGFTGETIIK